MNSSVSAVIVTFSSSAVIRQCLRSLRGLEEIIVVDNASADETSSIVRREAPRIRLIANRVNRGFAAAVNQGVRASRSPLILLLNPDVELGGPLGPENPLVVEAARPEVGVVGGKLVGADGAAQLGFNVRAFPTPRALAFECLLLNRLWPSNPVNRRYRLLDFDFRKAQDVDQPAGAFLMFRREVFDQVGGFDERFRPIWFEDVDFCLRVQRAGFRNRYVPGCVGRHRGGHSLPALGLEQRQAAWYGNLLRFAGKHFPPAARRSLLSAVRIGLATRGFCSLLRGRPALARAFRATRKNLAGGVEASPSEADAELQGASAAPAPKS